MKHQRKLRNILLMPKIQLRYMYYLLALIVAPMSVLLTYTVIEFQKLRVEFSLQSGISTEALEALNVTLFRVSTAFAVALLFMVFIIIYGTVVISHRFVGPMHVINKYIAAMKNGEPGMQRDLRKDDEMKETLALLKDLDRTLNKRN